MTRVNCIYPDGHIEKDAYVFLHSAPSCEYDMLTLWMLLNHLASSVNDDLIREKYAHNIIKTLRGTLYFEQGDLVYITISPAINKIIAECVELAKKVYKGPQSDYPYWHQIECDLEQSSMTFSQLCGYRDFLKARPSYSDDDEVWDKWNERERRYCEQFGILKDTYKPLPNIVSTVWPGVYNTDLFNY